MHFMNEYDIHEARNRYIRDAMPNRLALVFRVDHLREWTNQHLDGWSYWPKPVRAAANAMKHIAGRASEDITDAEMRLAARPVKAFLTREEVGPYAREIILRSVS